MKIAKRIKVWSLLVFLAVGLFFAVRLISHQSSFGPSVSTLCNTTATYHCVVITQADNNTTKMVHVGDVLDFEVPDKQNLGITHIPSESLEVVKKLNAGVYQVVEQGTVNMAITERNSCPFLGTCSQLIALLFQVTIVAH